MSLAVTMMVVCVILAVVCIVLKTKLTYAEYRINRLNAVLDENRDFWNEEAEDEDDVEPEYIFDEVPPVYDCEIDFDSMDVVSVERTEGKTILGYIAPDNTTGIDKIKEWNLFINHDQHQELVKKFRDYLSQKYGKDI